MSAVKILYVEDEVFLGKIVRESLIAKGYDVCMVQDGKAVISHLENFDPDICVLDVMLPSIDGYTLAKKIKASQSELPIIFVSAKNQTEDVVKGFQVGGSDYLRKPFSIEELVVRIESLLARKSGVDHRESEIKLGEFVYSPAELKIRHGEDVKELSHRMNEVLYFLCKYRDQIIDRRELLKTLWGDDSYFNSRNLDVYIRKIRHHLSKDPTIKIVTLKGVGYRLLVDSRGK